MAGRWASVVVGLLCCVGLVACANDADREATTNKRSDPGTGQSDPADADGGVVWSTTGIEFASQPTAVAGLLVAYVAVDGGLQLAAFDPEDGSEQWRRDSSGSSVTPGVVIEVAADEQRVYHYAPTGRERRARAEAIDAKTGEPAWTSPSAQKFSDPLDFCSDDDESALCAAVSSTDTEWEFATADGASTTRPVAGRSLGQGLYDGNGEVARTVDGRELWRRTPSEMFDGADVTPDNGWSWWEEDSVLVGTFGKQTARDQSDGPKVRVLGEELLAGIDADTGETLWVDQGEPLCGRLHGAGLHGSANPRVRCLPSGNLIYDDGGLASANGIEITLEGFEPRTGETTWETTLTGVSGIYDEDQPLVRYDEHTFGLRKNDRSYLSVDLRDGSTTKADPARVGWRFEDNPIDYDESYGSKPLRAGASYAVPSRLDEKPAQAPQTVDEEVGAVAGGRYAWMDADGLHAIKKP